MGKPVDILGHLFTPESIEKHFLGDEEELAVFESLGRAKTLKGMSVEDFKKYVEEVGLGRTNIASFYGWSYRFQRPYLHVTPEEVYEVTKQLPGIAYGLYGVNPFDALRGVKHWEYPKLCVSDRAHAVFRYGQASKRPANIMAS